MQRKKLPVGIEDFEKLRKEGFCYIDKTDLIRDLLNNWGEVNLFTRPRRFGKTLNMSMLKNFFEIGADKALFDGLNFANARDMLWEVIKKELWRMQYLMQDDRLSQLDKETLSS